MPGTTRIFIFQPGGLGDVILTGHLVSAVKRSFPTQTVILGLDSSLQHVPGLFPIAPDEIVAFNLSPFTSTPFSSDYNSALRAFAERLQSLRIDTFVDAGHRMRWFSSFVGAASGAGHVVAPPDIGDEGESLRAALASLGLAEPLRHFPTLPLPCSEVQRYRALAAFLHSCEIPADRWNTAESSIAAARQWLAAANIAPRKYLIAFPLGAASVPIKRWPMDRFITVLAHLRESENLEILFAGTHAEERELRAAAACFHPRADVFTGGPAEVGLFSGLVSLAAGFLGNDTGPAHLAQALNVPGVIVFGGGQGAAYAPWAPGATAILNTLPCFGCDWRCHFDHTVCVDSIPESVVYSELPEALRWPRRQNHVVDISVFESERFEAATSQLVLTS